jgi:hypothetical protein
MVTVDAEGRCIYCAIKTDSSGGCVRKECLDARMKDAMRNSTGSGPSYNSPDQTVVKNVFVKN